MAGVCLIGYCKRLGPSKRQLDRFSTAAFGLAHRPDQAQSESSNKLLTADPCPQADLLPWLLAGYGAQSALTLQGQVVGAAYFRDLAAFFPDHAELLQRCRALEHRTAASLAPRVNEIRSSVPGGACSIAGGCRRGPGRRRANLAVAAPALGRHISHLRHAISGAGSPRARRGSAVRRVTDAARSASDQLVDDGVGKAC